MMDVEKLIRRLRNDADAYRNGETLGRAFADQEDVLDNAATALSTLQDENEKLRVLAELGNMRAKDYRVMRDRAVKAEAENEKLRAELESVRAERNAAVEDVTAIIGDVEEIRRGYGVDNADADGAFAELCGTYCANNGWLCYAECEKYHCKNFKWRGQRED